MARKSCTSSPDLFTSVLAAPPKSEVLEQLAGLVDWEGLRGVLEGAYKLGGPGREPVDPVMLFKLLLLERLYNLSDGDAVWMARDSSSFRSFLGLGAGDRVPDDTTLVGGRRGARRGCAVAQPAGGLPARGGGERAGRADGPGDVDDRHGASVGRWRDDGVLV